jgi:hypothetical protein
MSKLIVAAAAFCTTVFLSVPAFSESPAACQQRCLGNCAGKGNFCAINCEGRCARYGTAKRG